MAPKCLHLLEREFLGYIRGLPDGDGITGSVITIPNQFFGFSRMNRNEDVIMDQEPNAEGSLLKLPDATDSKLYLVKLPKWLADAVEDSKPGTIFGQSSAPLHSLPTERSSLREGISLELSSSFSRSGNPSGFTITLPSGQQNLRVLERANTTTTALNVSSTVHMIPKRDEKYTAVLRNRLAQTDQTHQHRTVANEEEYATSRTAVKLFQRVESSPEGQISSSSPDSVSRPGSKRIRQLDELPQTESKGIGATSSVSLDDALMETLVNNDQGWPLQQLGKALKEKGVSVSMNQLKAKLQEICVYQRRGEDNYPKYYLKSEYK
jgi:hypothetical protein